MDTSYFDLGALYSYIAYPYADTVRAEIVLGHLQGTTVLPTTEDEFCRLLLIASTVEHEFTHHRQLLSTPLGLALYLITLACTECRASWLQSVPYPDFSRFVRDQHGNANPIAFVQQYGLERHPCFEHLFITLHWTLLLDVFFDFNIRAALQWQMQRDRPAAHLIINPDVDEVEDIFGWFSLLFVDDQCHILSSLPSANLMELIEGAAVWREYAYVSGTLWGNFRPLFCRGTRWWLERSIRSDRYRRAGDLVMQSTGCNLSSALPGVLFDIALTPPIFASRRVPWSEAHPSLRFAQILQVCKDLPKGFRRYDNIHLVGEDYYREIEQWICRKLGWASVEQNLQGGHDAVMARHRFVEHLPLTQERLMHDVSFLKPILTRFAMAHRERLRTQSMFLFPWVRKDYSWYRLLTCPPITEYSDIVLLNPQTAFNETLQLAILYGYRAVTTLFLGHTLNRYGAENMALARRLYDKLVIAITNYLRPEMYGSVGFSPTQSFESFISESLQIDYETHRQIVTGLAR